MKNLINVLLVFAFYQNVNAGPFVAGGNGSISLAYCSTDNGDFGAQVSKDISGNLYGYSWTNQNEISKVSAVQHRAAILPGTPNEKPMSLKGKNFQIQVYMGNLPAQNGEPIFRTGLVKIKTSQGVASQQLSCTLFGIDQLK